MAWTRYASNTTGWEGEIWLGRIFTPRFYCCSDIDSPIQLYAEKPPVAHLSLVPRVQFLGEAIAWDIGDSYSPTDTVDLFYIDWGGGTDIGDLSGEDFNVDPTSGSVVYDDLGTYTVEAYVKDVLTTESQHVFITVEIVEPEERAYIGTTDLGVFVMVNGATPVASNTGLSGDQLKLRALRVHPAFADMLGAQQHVWIATKDGVSYSTDGGATWTNITEATLGTPVNSASDNPAPTAADLDNIDLAFDSQDSRRVYLLRTWASPKRAWLYLSTDYGASWSSTQVGF